VAWRDTNGAFGSVDQLGEVDGIGPARLAKLRDLVHV
jgi:competence protein ComEA